MQRHHPGLDTEPEKSQQKDCSSKPQTRLPGIERPKLERSAGQPQQSKQGKKSKCAGVGADQVQPARGPDFVLVFLGADQKKRRQRHDLPGEEKRDAIGCQHHQRHRRDQKPVAELQPPRRSRMLPGAQYLNP